MNDKQLAEIVAEGNLRVPEAAKLAGVSRSTLYGWMAGDLPYLKIGKCRRIPAAALKRFLADHLVTK